jgi:hypothetical protein
MQWIYSEVSILQCHVTYFISSLLVNHLTYIHIQALKRAELFGIYGVTYSLTQVCFLFIDKVLPMI